MTSRLLPSVATMVALACSGSALTRGDSFSDYTDKLLVASSLPPGGASCAMFGGTRVGRCLLTRSAADVQSIVQGALPLKAEVRTAFYGNNSCATIPGFGVPNGPQRFNLLPGATRFVPDGGPLPPNSNNVKLNEIVVAPNGTDVCFEYQYPYG